MHTYGNALYEFCLIRNKLKFFHHKSLWINKINHLLGLNVDIVKAVTKEVELPYIEEFYREYNFEKYQQSIRNKMQQMLAIDMKSKTTSGDDFNAFMLRQNKD